ncbi:cell wall anchor protein [Micromonospora sp. CPCC 206061]|uniref:cell wall anchor protein n=1 Tax=Micromonospora sp. CPCC 206061 TaxID=3122410 RepID=UPI002FF3DC4C
MNRSKLSLRRPLTLLGAALLGAAAAVAIASPASAHHSEVAGKAVCDTTTGEWIVTWTVTSVAPPGVERYKLIKADLTPAGSTVTNIAASTGDDYPYEVSKPVVGEQRVPGSTESASLTVQAQWKKGKKDFVEPRPSTGTVTLGGECEKDVPSVTAPTASFASDCEGAVKVTLANGEEANKAVQLTVTAKDFEQKYTLEPGTSKDDIVVPAGAGKISVAESGKDAPLSTYTWEQPKGCVEPDEPEGEIEFTCDEMIFTIKNPANGETVTVTFTPNTGEPQTLVVEPGQTKQAKFPASEGLTVTASSEESGEATFAWEQPEGCEEGSGGGGGDLPVTGVAATGIAAGALVLLAVGVMMFMIARRRRTTFTA